MKKIISYGLALCAILLVSCEKDLYENSLQQPQQRIVNGDTKFVTLKDVPFLKPSVEKFKNKMTSKGIEDLDLDLEHIIEYLDTNGYKSYSIAVIGNYDESEDYYFENLHIIKIGEDWKPFIAKYNPEDDSKSIDFATFTGKMEFIDIDQTKGGILYFENGNKLIPVAPPTGNPEDIGGSGGDSPDGPPPAWMPNWLADLLGYWNGNPVGGPGFLTTTINTIIHSISQSCNCNINTPYVIVVTTPSLGTYTPNNDPQESTNGPGVIIAPNIPQWPAYVPNVHIRRNLIAARLSGLSPDAKSWLLNTATPEQTQSIFSYLIEYNYTDAVANNFAIEAIKAIQLGGTVNFPNEVIIDPTFQNNIKVKCVYDKLISLNNSFFNNTIHNTFGATKNAKIRFKAGQIPIIDGEQYNARTYPSINGSNPRFYNIVFDNDFVSNASTIEIAEAIIHELIHAELAERCYMLNLITGSLPNGSLIFANSPTYQFSDQIFAELVEQYTTFVPTTANPTEFEHNLFTISGYQNSIINDLNSINLLLDPNNDFQSIINADPLINNMQQVFESLSWAGLEATDSYLSLTPENIATINHIDGRVNQFYTHECQ